jgi:hypothetical protein
MEQLFYSEKNNLLIKNNICIILKLNIDNKYNSLNEQSYWTNRRLFELTKDSNKIIDSAIKHIGHEVNKINLQDFSNNKILEYLQILNKKVCDITTPILIKKIDKINKIKIENEKKDNIKEKQEKDIVTKKKSIKENIKKFTTKNSEKVVNVSNDLNTLLTKSSLNFSEIYNDAEEKKSITENFVGSTKKEHKKSEPIAYQIENNYISNSLTEVHENNGTEFSSVIDNSKILFKMPEVELVDKNYFIFFESKDRDLYTYPIANSFQIKFVGGTNTQFIQPVFDKYGTLLINSKEIIYGEYGINLPETFDNISCIKLLNVTIPTNTIFVSGDTSSNYPNQGNAIPTNIFKEPYLLLEIPELRGPYTGGNNLIRNSFAKLKVAIGGNGYASGTNRNTIVGMNTSDSDENFKYDPVTMGKIDKMTLNVLNKTGAIYNFGLDKLYIEEFLNKSPYSSSMSTDKYNGVCGGKISTTVVHLQQINSEYIKYCSLNIGSTYITNGCNYLNSHTVDTGDLIYFYNTRPECNNINFLEEYIKVSNLNFISIKGTTIYTLLEITSSYDLNGETVNINFKELLIPFENLANDNYKNIVYSNYYIVIQNIITNQYYYFIIDTINDNYVTVQLYNNKFYDDLQIYGNQTNNNYNNYKIGVAKKNLAGSNSNDTTSIFSIGGYYVINSVYQLTDPEKALWYFEINYPYNNVLSDYAPGEIFIIQNKLQIDYTFQITCKVKKYAELTSIINDSGNN